MKNLHQNQQFPKIITDKWGQEFAQNWLLAWNARDVEKILGFYSDEFLMMSPVVREMTGNQQGVLIDKEGLRDLCIKVFTQIPELQFSLAAVAVGIDSLTVHYTSSQCDMVADVMNFNNNWKIVRSSTFY